nr:unnamed protein product [Callosobruchus chinensis]
MEFSYSRESLMLLLKANGFYWSKCQNERKILMEKRNILHWRYKYLRSIRRYREEGRNFIYLDETWLDLTFKKCWQSEDAMGVVSNISSTGHLIIVHAGSQDGFVRNACLIIKAGQASGDNNGQMNQENFTKWLSEKTFPQCSS